MRNGPSHLRNLVFPECVQKNQGILGTLLDGSVRIENYIKKRVGVHMKWVLCDPVIAYNVTYIPTVPNFTWLL